MIKWNLDPGAGVHYDHGMLTLNFAESRVPVLKNETGLYVQGTTGGSTISGLLDQQTLKNTGNGQIIGANAEILAHSFLMCQYNVTNRKTKATYAVDTSQNKTINEVVAELNAVQDKYASEAIDIPMGMAKTGYILSVNDLFGFRTSFLPMQYSDGTNTWPCAMDSGNRSENDTLTALFVVQSVTYNDKYLTGLQMKCLWSQITGLTKGDVWTYGS